MQHYSKANKTHKNVYTDDMCQTQGSLYILIRPAYHFRFLNVSTELGNWVEHKESPILLDYSVWIHIVAKTRSHRWRTVASESWTERRNVTAASCFLESERAVVIFRFACCCKTVIRIHYFAWLNVVNPSVVNGWGILTSARWSGGWGRGQRSLWTPSAHIWDCRANRCSLN